MNSTHRTPSWRMSTAPRSVRLRRSYPCRAYLLPSQQSVVYLTSQSSLGCAAVFLIGGLTRDDPPTPILLRSGDIVVMSGPACRRAYHGTPHFSHIRTTAAAQTTDPSPLLPMCRRPADTRRHAPPAPRGGTRRGLGVLRRVPAQHEDQRERQAGVPEGVQPAAR